MKTYIEKAKAFIQHFYPFMKECTNIHEFEDAIGYYNMVDHKHIEVSRGSTRVCLLSRDFVIKIDYCEDEDSHEFGDCESELRLYEEAVEDNMDYLFAEVTRYFYRNIFFYIMPRIGDIYKTWDNATRFMSISECLWCKSKGLFDIGSGNYGWRDGKICIFDYAANSM